MFQDIFIFACALALVIRGATYATRYAARLAENYRLSKYAVGFIVVAVISILPEGLISLNAAVSGLPAMGLGTLFGSNVADLTLVFALVTSLAGRGIKIESKILKSSFIYPLLLLFSLILGLDGYYSRLEGLALILAGGAFYYFSLKNGLDGPTVQTQTNGKAKNAALLLLSMALLLVGAHYTVDSAASLAGRLGVSPILIGMLIVGLGTTIPELLFSLSAVKKRHDSLAVGDILGTVLADATVLVGLIALISPFSFPRTIVYSTGAFMLSASVILFYFMRSGRFLSRRESLVLLVFWLGFIATELALAG